MYYYIPAIVVGTVNILTALPVPLLQDTGVFGLSAMITGAMKGPISALFALAVCCRFVDNTVSILMFTNCHAYTCSIKVQALSRDVHCTFKPGIYLIIFIDTPPTQTNYALILKVQLFDELTIYLIFVKFHASRLADVKNK